MTHNRRIRLEVTAPDADPHIPSMVRVYPTNDWHERETYDMFGIIFDGHPALTRILMPDDWPGHPQRKDYPLGGIPVEYKGGDHPAARPAEVLQLMTTPRPTSRQDAVTLRRHAETTEGRVFTVTGQDWDSITQGLATRQADERVVVNMGPQHPSTHGVLRLILELEGETVTEARCGIGYLHTGIEKNMEYRSWVQGVTFCTRMDYLSPFYNEMTYVPRRRAAARHRGRHPGEGPGHAGPADGAQPHLLAPGLHRHRRHGDRRADRDDDRLPRARAGARPVRADHRPADEPRVHPPGGVAQDLPPGRARRDPRLHRADEEAPARVRRPVQRQPDLQGPPRGTSATSTSRAAWRSGITGPVLRSDRLPLGPAQDPAVLRLRGLRLRGPDLGHLRLLRPVPDPPQRDVGVAQDRRAGRRPAGRPRGRPGDGRRQEDRLAQPARDRQRRHGQQPRPHPATSWASRWRP